MSPKYTAQERLKLIERVILGKEPVAWVCQEAGISRVLLYSWLKKYREAGQQIDALVPGRKKKAVSPKKVTPGEEEQILAIVKEHPSWSTKKISAVLPKDSLGKPIVGNHGVQNVLQRLNLSTEKARIAHVRAISRPKEEVLTGVKLTPEQKLEMLERVVVGKEKVSKVRQEYGISRTLFYRLKRRYEEAALEEKLRAVTPAVRHIERYWRQTPERYERAVLDLVGKHPEYSVRKLVEHLPEVAGVPIVGHHGVQNILQRHNLSLYEQRQAFASAQVTPITRFISTFEQAFARFFVFPVETRAAVVRFFSILSLSAFLTVVVLGGLGYFATVFRGVAPIYRPGLIFASIALSVGSIFFLYSMKYYFTLAIVLSFSRQPGEPAILGLNGEFKKNGNGGWLGRIFGFGNGPSAGSGLNGKERRVVGLEPNLESVKLEKHPFISVHLPFYNEKKVAERILSACTSFDYENYEIVVVDDSTDETVEILKGWQNHPKVKIIHRKTRAGFKGGALRLALSVCDPRTEFVVVFDADFIPYPDTLELFLKYFKTYNNDSEDFSKSNIACVQGYQWHVLNKSENWVTRGIRSEYAGSYVIERSGTEVLGALKQIAGSVYMIRAEILKKFGWGTSITEDFELTLRLYEQGYKVVYTPYVQGPAECVSTIKRLIRQRMRWAEGHSFNVRKMFFKLLFGKWESVNSKPTAVNRNLRFTNDELRITKKFIPSPLTLTEKLEFLYLSPYYLQAFFFLVGTFSWLMAETVFRARLPFWTSLWGWSLVLTNFFSLPLMNAVGLFLEEGENKDYLGILSFIALSYLLVPFQAYASIKGFLEREEGPWFRTPKTGLITDIFTRGKFYRWISGIIPGRFAPARISTDQLQMSTDISANQFPISANPYIALATANNRFSNFKIRPKRLRWVSKAALVILLCLTVSLYTLAHNISVVWASTNPSGTWSIDSVASANISTSWQLKDNTWGTLDSLTIASPKKALGNFQYQPGLTNGTSGTPGTPNGKGWIFDTPFWTEGGNTGSIGTGNWTFTICTTDTDTEGVASGYLRVILAAVGLTGTPPNQTIASSSVKYDSAADCDTVAELWEASTNANDSCTKSSLTGWNFDSTNPYLYVEFWNIVDVANDDNTDKSTFHVGDTACTTDPRVVTTGTVTIPETVIILALIVPFLPYFVKWLKKRKEKWRGLAM